MNLKVVTIVSSLILFESMTLAQVSENREWTDSTGKFKVMAKLLEVKEGVAFLQSADGKTLKIPINRLSASDQQLLNSSENPFEMVAEGTGANPPISSGSGSGNSNAWSSPKSIQWSAVEEVVPTPGVEWNVSPTLFSLDFEPKRAGLPKKSNFHENMHPPVVNLECKRAVLGHTVSFSVPKPLSRISLIDMVSGRAIHSEQVEAQMRPLALMDSGSAILMVGTSDERGGYETGDQLQLWKLNGKKIVRTPSWVPHPDERKSFGKTQNAAIGDAWPISENLVLTLSNSAHLVLWDIYQREPMWHARLNQQNFGVDVSADRKYVAIFNDKTVSVVDAQSAEVLGSTTLDVQRVGWNRIRWSPNGKKLLLSSVGDLRVLNVGTGELETDIHLSDAPMATKNLSFPHEDYALLDNHLLVHLPSRIKVCDYSGAALRVVGDSAFIGVQAQSTGVFVTAQFPHPKAEETLKRAQDDPTMFLLHPGVSVGIDVSQVPSQHRQTVESGLKKSIEASGYRFDPSAAIRATAKISGPKTEAVSYIARGSYVVNQYTSTVELKWQGKSIWSRSGTNIPHFLQTRGDETIQQALDRLGKEPNTSMFAGIRFPEFMQKPNENGTASGNALMSSKFTVNGLVDSM